VAASMPGKARACLMWRGVARAPARARARLLACVSTCVRACLRACVRVYVRACVRACAVCESVNVCVDACVNACVRACARQVTIKLCKLVHISPVPLLVGEAIFSNLGGTATMIGDPPNILIGNMLADYVNFNAFLINLAPGVLLSAPAVFW
jgi:Na+/H+ antiporter NhaB